MHALKHLTGKYAITVRSRRAHDLGRMTGGLLILIATLFSFLSIISTILAFANPNVLPDFVDSLNQLVGSHSGVRLILGLAKKDITHLMPQVVLVGENVDVDVDEPSVTIRWSVIGCGQDFKLLNSPPLFSTQTCGAPSTQLSIYGER